LEFLYEVLYCVVEINPAEQTAFRMLDNQTTAYLRKIFVDLVCIVAWYFRATKLMNELVEFGKVVYMQTKEMTAVYHGSTFVEHLSNVSSQ